MPTFLQNFKQFVQEQELFFANEKVLVAISGGVDSMVLAELMLRMEVNFALAHCNFGLRGAESDGDEQFVRNWAEKNQVQLFVKKFKTKEFAKKRQISTQMAARLLRYAWFEELLEAFSFHYLATAHHQSDNIETILLNLVRGTGIAGLHGILPKSNQIIRPLLFAKKTEIEQYALENQIQWREDSSNQQNTYKRNLLRNQVIPLLQQLNPNLEETIAESMEKIGAVERFFKLHIQQLKEKVMTKNGELFQITFAYFQTSKTPEIELYELIKAFGFGYKQAQQIVRSLGALSGTQFYSHTHQLLKDRNAWLIQPLEKSIGCVSTYFFTKESLLIQTDFWTLKGEILLNSEDFELDKNPQIAYLDLNKITFPLELRKWKSGDFFYPLGMNNRKKISDFLIDLKVSLIEKENIWLLCNQEEIVWVMGYRIDNRYKITSDTKEILKLEIS